MSLRAACVSVLLVVATCAYGQGQPGSPRIIGKDGADDDGTGKPLSKHTARDGNCLKLMQRACNQDLIDITQRDAGRPGTLEGRCTSAS
jgi:hypothetical protein